ncbi:MAG: hypothetical protein IT342_09610 [Candidatus Melainabacteria bacterium]|nr:hypothetical protein [Candidatus Melainabacteria bacterium]
MTLLESARGTTTSVPEQFEEKRVSDGQFAIASVSDAWAPRTENSNGGDQQITPEMAFLPFTRFAMAENIDFNPRRTLGLAHSWGYTRQDSELNPGGGRCHASSDSMTCGSDTGSTRYRGSHSDAPQLYGNRAQVNGNPITTQYFAPTQQAVKSPENYRYLNNTDMVVQPVNYTTINRDVASVLPAKDKGLENLERGLEKQIPISWRDNSLDAFVEAVESDKPMVVVFGDDSSPLFNRQIQEMKSDKDNLMSRLSSRAVFVVGKPAEDEYARRMASHLKLTDYPTISVIAPRTDQLTETYRMEGYFQVSDVYKDLDLALPKAKSQQKPELLA